MFNVYGCLRLHNAAVKRSARIFFKESSKFVAPLELMLPSKLTKLLCQANAYQGNTVNVFHYALTVKREKNADAWRTYS